MGEYFVDVVSNLTYEDFSMLSYLFDQDATAAFKAIRSQEVKSKTDLTDATFRKVANRLLGNKFIETVTSKKQYSLYITTYGIKAIQKSLEEVSVG